MANAATTYGGNSVSTVSSADPYDSGNNDMLDFWNAMARKRVAAQNAAPVARRTTGFGRSSADLSKNLQGQERNQENPMAARAQAAKLRALEAESRIASAKAAAATTRIPTRMSTVGGQTFATPDHLAMTGAQREVFLPQNAGTPERGMFEGMNEADQDFLINMRRGRQRPAQEMFTLSGGD